MVNITWSLLLVFVMVGAQELTKPSAPTISPSRYGVSQSAMMEPATTPEFIRMSTSLPIAVVQGIRTKTPRNRSKTRGSRKKKPSKSRSWQVRNQNF
ncbi:hypothetical protein ElyMa_005878300 [Elysia marginata]|uniref:Uncharacterized protein n=1 Tax=Elysia marginata TaxID=1093978 RepID=A0AAV4G1K5_9GAST|nr:hypothetical protein ElyMa_005878300 [Elysia marginata]